MKSIGACVAYLGFGMLMLVSRMSEESVSTRLLWAFVGLTLLACGSALHQYGRRRSGQVSVADAMKHGPAQTVLYLRSFTDDHLSMPDDRPVSMKQLLGTGAQYFEEYLVSDFRNMGQVIAIADPRVKCSFAPVGATRLQVDESKGEDWRQKVLTLIQSCKAIIIIAGQTGGLSWEVRKVAELGALKKTYIVFPPDGSLTKKQTEARRASIERVLHPFIELPEMEDTSEQLICIRFDRENNPLPYTGKGAKDNYIGIRLLPNWKSKQDVTPEVTPEGPRSTAASSSERVPSWMSKRAFSSTK